jgi:predicted phage tail protein
VLDLAITALLLFDEVVGNTIIKVSPFFAAIYGAAIAAPYMAAGLSVALKG